MSASGRRVPPVLTPCSWARHCSRRLPVRSLQRFCALSDGIPAFSPGRIDPPLIAPSAGRLPSRAAPRSEGMPGLSGDWATTTPAKPIARAMAAKRQDLMVMMCMQQLTGPSSLESRSDPGFAGGGKRSPMFKRAPGSREEDSWLSEKQLRRLARADEGDALGSPIPTQVVSNGEYFPMPQTLQQKQVEARIAELAGETAKRLGMSRRRFLASSAGMATAFVAMNEVHGRFFDVNPLEMLGSAHAQGAMPHDLFVFDDQLHMIRQ